MKQVLINGKGNVILEDVPAPSVLENGVLVKTAYSLISSGTEATAAKDSGSLVKKVTGKPELIRKVYNQVITTGISATINSIKNKLNELNLAGYSASGVVIEKGDKISGVEVGDYVACAGVGFANHAEIISVPKNLFVPVPDGVDLKEACFVTLGAIAMQGVRRAKVEFGETVVVIGLGLVGQIVSQILQVAGCQVIGLDLAKSKVELASKMGVSKAILLGDIDPIKEVMDYTKGVGADTAIICAGTSSSEPINLAFSLLRDKGRVSVIGVVGMELDRTDFYLKELDLISSRSYGPGRYDKDYEEKGIDYPIGYVRWTENRNMEEFLRLILEKRVDVKSLITHEFPIENSPEAYKVILNPEIHSVGVVLKYGDLSSEIQTRELKAERRIDLASQKVDGKINVAVVGTGDVVKSFHLPNIKRISEYNIAAIVSSSGDRAKQLAKRYEAKYCTTDFQEVLNDPEINLVFIANKHYLHAPMAIAAAKAGKNIFLEKPMAMNYDECLEVVKAIKESSVQFTVGFNRRFSPPSIKAKEVLMKLGGPTMINYRVNAGPLAIDHWLKDPGEGGGRIIGETCHFFDLFYWFIGAEPISLFATNVSTDNPSITNEENVFVSVKFADGSAASLCYSALGHRAFPKERIEIFKGNTVIVIDDFQRLHIEGFKKRNVKLRTVDKGHFDELVEYKKALKGEESSVVTVEDGLRATICSLKVLDSTRDKKVVEIQLP